MPELEVASESEENRRRGGVTGVNCGVEGGGRGGEEEEAEAEAEAEAGVGAE